MIEFSHKIIGLIWLYHIFILQAWCIHRILVYWPGDFTLFFEVNYTILQERHVLMSTKPAAMILSCPMSISLSMWWIIWLGTILQSKRATEYI